MVTLGCPHMHSSQIHSLSCLLLQLDTQGELLNVEQPFQGSHFRVFLQAGGSSFASSIGPIPEGEVSICLLSLCLRLTSWGTCSPH